MNALNMTESFLKKGYTEEQAKLKVVWENPNIASICSAMPNMTILQANVAAALNKNKLSLRDKQLFEQYAHKTAGGYCAGCADICESAVDFRVPISDVLRCSMYYNSYGDRDKALALFNALPTIQIRKQIFVRQTIQKQKKTALKIYKLVKQSKLFEENP